ncbi:phosphatase PAP2 family protein [Microbacterium sp. GXF7504]
MEALLRPVSRLLLPGLVLLVLASALGAWISLQGPAPFAMDTAWNSALVKWRVTWLEVFSLTLGVVGGVWASVIVTVAGAVLLLLFRRPRSAAFLVAAQLVSAGLVQALKHLFGRARPEEIIVVSDYGSFPSGHAANAATLAVVAFVLFPRVWVAVAGALWVVLMAFSRTYLHAHWVSDTIGGALVGAGAVLVTAAAFAPLLRRESPAHPGRPHPPA